MSVVSVVQEGVSRVCCLLVWACNTLDLSSGSAGEAIAHGLDISTDACHAPTQGPGWRSASSLHAQQTAESDALSWSLKLLFVPALGLLLLAALLEEYCFAHAHGGGIAPGAAPASAAASSSVSGGGVVGSQSGPGPTTLFGWVRQFLSRGPKLTTAYQNQLKANATVGGTGASHTHAHAPGSCACTHAASTQVASSAMHTSLSATSASSSGDLSTCGGTGSGPFHAPLSLQLNFNGFNQLLGPLQYYHTFQREERDETKKTATNAGTKSKPKSPTAVATNGGMSPKASEYTKEGKSPKSPAGGKKSKDSSPLASPLASPPSPTALPSPSSPAESDFIPLTLVNESTGFSRTFSLWRHLTFGEILAYYIDAFWSEERAKYDGFEGGADAAGSAKEGRVADDKTADEPWRAIDTPPLMMRHQGTRISALLTPAAVFPCDGSATVTPTTTTTEPTDQQTDATDTTPAAPPALPAPPRIPVLEVCIDYFLLFDRLRTRSHASVLRQNSLLRTTAESRSSLAASLDTLTSELALASKRAKESGERAALLRNEQRKLAKDAERLERELTSLRNERTEVETSIGESVGLISNLKSKLEREYAELKTAHDAKTREFADAKSAYATSLDQRHQLSVDLKGLMIRYETLEKRCHALKVHKGKHEKVAEKIRKLEAALGPTPETSPTSAPPDEAAEHSSASSSSSSSGASPASTVSSPAGPDATTVSVPVHANAAQRMKARYDALEQEHNVLNAQLNELRIASHEIDDLSKNEHYKLRYRLKLLEKDARDLAKWKSVARHAEGDARESVRWKLALKQAKARERTLEKDLHDTDAWKMRARAFEKEVREMRAWKRNVEAAAAAGLGQESAGGGVVIAPPGFISRGDFGVTTGGPSVVVGGVSGAAAGVSVLQAHAAVNPLVDDYVHASVSGDTTPPDMEHVFGAFRTTAASLLRPTNASANSSVSTDPTDYDDFGLGVSSRDHAAAFDMLAMDDATSVGDAGLDPTDFTSFGGTGGWTSFATGPHHTPRTSSFDATLLNSHSPDVRTRELAGADVAAAAAAAAADQLHEPEFTHTLPAFLAE